ncbi:MAG: hypothetical protein HUJ16_02390 [Kangiella sp.]|nr:hypothetical protein [Kangiella sp.]
MSQEQTGLFSASEALINKVKSPYIVIFITSWIFHNWKLITALITLDLPYYQLIGRLEGFFNLWDLLLWPVTKSLGIYLLFLILTFCTKVAYSFMLYKISEKDDKINDRHAHTERERSKYYTAFFEFGKSDLLQHFYSNKSAVNSYLAEKIYTWHKSYEDIMQEPHGSNWLDHFSTRTLNGGVDELGSDYRNFANKYDLIEFNDGYSLSFKGAYIIEKHKKAPNGKIEPEIAKKLKKILSSKLPDTE